MISVLPSDISDFYERLVESESRHFLMYLGFARDHSRVYSLDFENKLDELLCMESEIITRSDNNFGFHSGPSQLD